MLLLLPIELSDRCRSINLSCRLAKWTSSNCFSLHVAGLLAAMLLVVFSKNNYNRKLPKRLFSFVWKMAFCLNGTVPQLLCKPCMHWYSKTGNNTNFYPFFQKFVKNWTLMIFYRKFSKLILMKVLNFYWKKLHLNFLFSFDATNRIIFKIFDNFRKFFT